MPSINSWLEFSDTDQPQEIDQKLGELRQSLLEIDIEFDYDFNPNLHDHEIRLDNSWTIKIGGGLDFYQKLLSWYELVTTDLSPDMFGDEGGFFQGIAKLLDATVLVLEKIWEGIIDDDQIISLKRVP